MAALSAGLYAPEYDDLPAENLADALAATTADFAVPQALRLSGSLAPEHAARILMTVLAAHPDPELETAAVGATDRMADPIMQAIARIDLSGHLRDPAHLALLPGWAALGPTAWDRAFLLGEFAAATGLPDLAEQAVAGFRDIPDDVDRRDAFERIITAVARGPDPARVQPLLAAFGPEEEPTRDAALMNAVTAMAQGGQAALATDLARAMTYDERMATALARIGAVTHDSALLAEALTLARGISLSAYRADVVRFMAAALLRAPGLTGG